MSPRPATLRDAAELVAAGLVAPAGLPALEAVAARYAVAITPAMARLINPADDDDPIARQFVPTLAELETRPEERPDPIGDDAHSPVPGIVHRYPDRVLLKLLTICPVYCRFCFRRETVGQAGAGLLPAPALERALAWIAGNTAIWEVILSGGDPLALSPRRLRPILARLGAIPHLAVIRLHTRVPVVAPERVNAGLVAALKASGKTTYVVLHANHPRELTPAALGAASRLIDAGMPMLSQSVLLAGVNDDPAVLAELMRAFVAARIKPYYLHHPDLAPGTAHFRVGIARGREIVGALRGKLSGLAQPTYVLDIPGGHGKAPLGPDAITPDGAGWTVTDHRGHRHAYRDSLVAIAPEDPSRWTAPVTGDPPCRPT